MRSIFKSLTIRSIVVAIFPAVGIALQNPTPETIAAAVVSVLAGLAAMKGRVRIGDLRLP